MAVNGCRLQNASWADLWDQTDAVAAHTHRGIEFLERLGAYAKERAMIEEEYAAKLRTLAKKSLGRKKEDEEAAKSFTYVRSFANLLHEVELLAGQHEVVGERIRKEVIPYVMTRAGVHRAQRKQCLADLQAIHANLTGAMEHVSKAQKHYGKTFKEAEAASLKYAKADKNMEISRLDLDRAKQNAQMRCNLCEEAKQAYAHALHEANDIQNAHYSQHLPEALARLRAIDLERIKDTRVAMELCLASEVEVRPIIARCHEDMKKAVEQIDDVLDTAMVVEQFKTGYMYPPPLEFEDLGRPDSCLCAGGEMLVDNTLKKGVQGGGRRDGKGVSRKQSMHQKFFGGADRHKSDTNADYGQLPPQQRIRRLRAKLCELERERDKIHQSRDGLAKMKQVYTDNPKMGNPADCDTQLCQYEKEIESISQQINRFRLVLEDVQLQSNNSVGSNDTAASADSGMSKNSASHIRPRHSQSSQRCSHSEESLASSEGGNNGMRNEVHVMRNLHEQVSEECATPALGAALAQFSFEGGTEGTIAIREGEELLLIERDEGDGWTRVRRIADSTEGFVPSSYLQCKWDDGGEN